MPILPINAITKATKVFDLRTPEAIAKDNGVVAGSPTFDRDGCNMNGSTDYAAYTIPTSLFASRLISVVVEFTPDFEADDGNFHYICSANGINDRIVKENGNKLTINRGGTTIQSINLAVYQPYWRVGKKNVLVITSSAVTNRTNAWLNGNQILTNDSTNWEPADNTTFNIGSNSAGTSPFDGKIQSFLIYNLLLTEDEVQDLYNNSSYNFQNKADIWLDMKAQLNDGSNDITKDKSGDGNDFLLGDGSTVSTQPSFINPGFDFDGSSDYINNPNSTGVYNNTYQTIVACFKPDFEITDGNFQLISDSSTGGRYILSKENTDVLLIYLGNTKIAEIARAAYESYWNALGLNVLCVTGTTGDTDVYLNGFKILDADPTPWTPKNPAGIWVGSNLNTTAFLDGKIFHFSTYGNKLAQKMMPIQARQLTQQLLNQYS